MTFDKIGDCGAITKSVYIASIAGMSKKDIADEIERQIDIRSLEADRHAEFTNSSIQLRPHRNPRHLHEQSIDTKLKQKIKRTDIEALLP